MPDRIVPPSLESVAALGEPMGVYTPGGSWRAAHLIGFTAGSTLGIGVIYYGIVVYPEQFPKVALTNSPVVIGFGVLLLLGILLWGRQIFSRRNRAAVVYRDGFAYFDGKMVSAFKWSDVALTAMEIIHYRAGGVIPTGASHKYTIVAQTGENVILDNTLDRVQELYRQIHQRTLPYITDRSQKAFQTGELVHFGSISISKSHGIQYRDKWHAWETIAPLTVDRGIILVRSKSRGLFNPFNINIANIPNGDVLWAITADMANQQPPSVGFDNDDSFDEYARRAGWPYDNGWQYQNESWDAFAGPFLAKNNYLVMLRNPRNHRTVVVHYVGSEHSQVWSGEVDTVDDFDSLMRIVQVYKAEHENKNGKIEDDSAEGGV